MEKAGRNDPCPCGSGKKFKKCCELKTGAKKINAQVLTPGNGAHKVSSLFLNRSLSPVSPSREVPETTL